MVKGKKTYLVALGAGTIQILYSLGIINQETYNLVMGLIAAAGAATLASKVNRVEDKVEQVQQLTSNLPNKLVENHTAPKIVVKSPIDK